MAKEKHWQELHAGASSELEMNMNMEHEQKMAMDREEGNLWVSIMLQCVAAYGGSQILQYP